MNKEFYRLIFFLWIFTVFVAGSIVKDYLIVSMILMLIGIFILIHVRETWYKFI